MPRACLPPLATSPAVRGAILPSLDKQLVGTLAALILFLFGTGYAMASSVVRPKSLDSRGGWCAILLLVSLVSCELIARMATKVRQEPLLLLILASMLLRSLHYI